MASNQHSQTTRTATKVRAGEVVADLVEAAKSEALDKLGEGERAFGIATKWLRGRTEEKPAVMGPTSHG